MASTPGTPRLLRAMNDRAALDLLLEQGPLSRTTLGNLTGLSKPTASQLLARLESAGLVRASGTSAGRPGPNAQLYEINGGIAYVAGLDVTPTRIRSAVADLTGKVVGSYELPTPGRSAKGTVERVVKALDGALGEAGLTRDRLHRVSIGTPGGFDPTTGRLRYATHLPGWHAPHLLEELAGAIAVPLEVENDVNLAAVAERQVGHANDSDNFVLLWGEEGIGAAIVIGGHLVRGATGGAGEVAFLPLPGTPLVRNVGRNNAGGFQELAGGEPVLALARANGLKARTPEAAIAAALQTPGAGDTVLTEFAHRLSVGLAAIVVGRRPGADRARGRRDHRRRRAVARPDPGRAGRTRRAETAAVDDRDPHRPSPGRGLAVRPQLHPGRSLRHCRYDDRGQHRLELNPFDTSRRTGTTHPARWIRTPKSSSAPPRIRRTEMPRVHKALIAAAAIALLGTACTGTSSAPKANDDATQETTITFWHGWTAPSEVKAIDANVKAFEAKFPNIKVKVVGNINDDKIKQALRAGGPNSPTWCPPSPPTTSAPSARRTCSRT